MKKRTQPKEIKKEIRLNGIAGSPGITQGEVLLFYRKEIPFQVRTIQTDQVPAEVDRFLNAISRAKQEISDLRKEYVEITGAVQEGMIFEAHSLILEDPLIVEKTISCIEKTARNAEYCFNLATQAVLDMLANLKNEFFRERATDILDVKRRILRNLTNNPLCELQNLQKPVVIVANDLGPTDTVSIDRVNVKAILTNVGGYTSHSVIVARSLGIPAVVALTDITARGTNDDILIVDGTNGTVIIHPEAETQKIYVQKQHEFTEFERSLTKLKNKPAITMDGFEIELSANIESSKEIEEIKNHGARGVGLFRTEYMCLRRNQFPSEEEQFDEFSAVTSALAPDPIIIRTYDIGGDKLPLLLDSEQEQNPFLGWRAIRFCLDHPEIFKSQLRAILRAGVKGTVKIMLPFISCSEEIVAARKILKEVEHDLEKEKIPFTRDYELGIMIETPSAAIGSDILAEYVDFFSIGTNDLTQYILAVDRGNERIADLYEPLNPSIIRMINAVIQNGHQAGIWVGVCGEMASNPMAAYLLVGLGVDELSTSPIFIPEVKRMIRAINFIDARNAALQVVNMKSAKEIKDFLFSQIKDILYSKVI